MTIPTRSTASRLALLIPAALVAFAPGLRAQEPEEDPDLGESPERYAQVKVLEGDATIHKGEADEPLTLGTPIAEGDVVESRGRGVLQLGDGTRIAFTPGTRLRVAALFSDQKGAREVLIRLDYGRIRVRVGPQSEARVRIDTPSGSGVLADRADATFDAGRDRSVRLRVHGGRTAFSNEKDRTTVRAGERLTVYSPLDNMDRLNDFNTYDEDEFDHWADNRLTPRRGESASRVPKEIRYYADDLDNHGRWVYVDECNTWCWSPTGVAADWRPYYDGRWGAYAGGMTWISSEPWGYVTYHHGRWGWGASLGWYWIPGVYYSPAWVAWHSSDSYFGWAPLGYYNRPCNWGYGAWGGGHCWNVVSVTYVNRPDMRGHYYNDPRIIRTFNQGTGTTVWTPGAPRAAQPGPWYRGRMIVTPGEFRDPVQIQRVAVHRELVRERVVTYDRAAQAATGRTILRREPSPERAPAVGAAPVQTRFEGERPRPVERPVFREAPTRGAAPAAPQGAQAQPAEGRRGEDRRPEANANPAPRERPRSEERRPEAPRDTPRERPRQEERQPEPSREAPRERPRMEERRPEAPRETPRQEFRPAPRETPREAPRQEARPAPREAPREAPRQESRPSAPSAPPARSEARPAPPARTENKPATRDNR